MEDKNTDSTVNNETNLQEEAQNASPNANETAGAEPETEKIKQELGEARDKYIRLLSDFDNFRKRTARERLELITTANEGLIVALLPVLDDFERAQKSFDQGTRELEAVKQGFDLIHNKIARILEQKGLKPMKAIGETFNPDLHEAITQIPAPSEDMKGKVVDEVEKGYYLGEKVIRFAKVVIGM